jgi:hypothetical protein
MGMTNKAHQFLTEAINQLAGDSDASSIDDEVRHPDTDVRLLAAGREGLQSHHIHALLNDAHPFVRAAAIMHPNAEADHLEKALKDSDRHVKIAALTALVSNPGIQKSILSLSKKATPQS